MTYGLTTCGIHRFVSDLVTGRPVEFAGLPKDEEALSQWTDWLTFHRFAGLAFESLPQQTPLKRALICERLRLIENYEEKKRAIQSLVNLADREGINLYSFKGWGIAHNSGVFEEPSLRAMGDIDLLVQPHDYERMLDLCRQNGIVPVVDTEAALRFCLEGDYHCPLWMPEGGQLEIHHRLYSDVPDAFVREALLEAAPCSESMGGTRPLTTPFLVFILAVHFLNNTKVRWLWVYEVIRLSELQSSAEWERTWEIARAYKLYGYLSCAFLLGESLWGLELSDNARQFIDRANGKLSILERAAIKRILSRAPEPYLQGQLLSVSRQLSGAALREDVSWKRRFFSHPDAAENYKMDGRSTNRFLYVLRRLYSHSRNILFGR